MSCREKTVLSFLEAALREKAPNVAACTAISNHGQHKAGLRIGNIVMVDDRNTVFKGTLLQVDIVRNADSEGFQNGGALTGGASGAPNHNVRVVRIVFLQPHGKILGLDFVEGINGIACIGA